jgi:hypothetical protein
MSWKNTHNCRAWIWPFLYRTDSHHSFLVWLTLILWIGMIFNLPKHYWEEFYYRMSKKPDLQMHQSPDVRRCKWMSLLMVNIQVTKWKEGIIIYLNCAPIIWYSKSQNSAESSTFRPELVARQIALEMIESLCYKLHMFGIRIYLPTNIFCDNKSIVINSTILHHNLRRNIIL